MVALITLFYFKYIIILYDLGGITDDQINSIYTFNGYFK